MIYDCFMFFDELDLLEIRMNILDPVVDFFVVTEATTTQMGQPKKMYFAENMSRFEKFKDKIIYNPVDMGNIFFENQWSREVYQKNHCIDGLEKANSTDLVIFSDLDEIPNPRTLKKIIDNFDSEKIYHFAQEMYYFFINYKNVDGTLLSSTGEFPGINEPKWLGTKVCTYKMAKEYGLDALRHKEMITNNENAIRVADGGWHFTYMGGTKSSVQTRIKKKFGAFSHAEFNRWRYYNPINIYLSILMGKDLLGRGARFKKVSIDDTYPSWLVEHYKEYPHLILR